MTLWGANTRKDVQDEKVEVVVKIPGMALAVEVGKGEQILGTNQNT